jgi:hypothetical protein
LVPYFNISEIYFSPGKVGVNIGILFIFQFSFQIEINDTLAIFLPGIDIDANSLLAGSLAPFSTTWSNTTYVLTLKSLQSIPLMSRTAVTINSSFTLLPSGGYPLNSSLPSIIATSYTRAYIHAPTRLSSVQEVGFKSATAHYQSRGIDNTVQIRFQFQLSDSFSMGDLLVFDTPVVVGPLGPLTVTGDEAEGDFKSPFSVTYGSGVFTLICTSLTSVLAREINLFIDYANGFSLIIPGGDYSGYGPQYAHYARGSLGSIGSLSNYHMGVQYTLDSQPISLNHPGPFIDGAVGISSCPLHTPCTLDLQIYIHKPLLVGEMLALTHPSFKVTAGLRVGGNGSALFGSYFRDADNTYKLQLGSTEVQVPIGSYIRSTGDRSYLKTSVSLPASANASISGVLVSSIPRILKVSNVHSFYLCLFSWSALIV